jgi:hypothetical protein
MTEIEVTENTLIVHVKGIHKILALKSQLEIPLAHVIGAEIDPAMVEQWGKVNLKGVKVGTSLPGVIKAGNFLLDGQWAFWDVNDPKQAITVRLTDEYYTKLVIEVADPSAAVAKIEGAIRSRQPS